VDNDDDDIDEKADVDDKEASRRSRGRLVAQRQAGSIEAGRQWDRQ
jgi:hypothetical protein